MPPPAPLLERQRPEQARRLWDAVAALKRDDPLAPVTVVGPSVYANLSLRQDLAARGFANVRFVTLARVSELLGAPRLVAARPGVSPLKPAIETTAIRAALRDAGADSRLSDFADNSGAIRSLRSTFRDLRGAADGALQALSDTGGLRQDVVSLYRGFAERTRDKFYDTESLARAAAEAVEDGAASGLDDLGFLIFYRVSDISAGEARLIRALSRAGVCAVYLGLTGDEEADALIRALARRLAPSPPADVADDAPEGADDALSPTPENARLLIAPTPREEIRWVIRRVMRDAENGTPFRETAILYRKSEPYSSLIPEELKLAGLPVAGPDPSPLSQTAVGRALTGLLNLAGSDFARDDVMSWLTGCPVKPPGTPASRFVPSRWDAISRKAGVVRGLEQWDLRLAAYADNLERRADDEDRGEIYAHQAAGMKAEARAARDLAAFVKTLAESLTPPPDGGAWAHFREWAWRTFEKYLTNRADIPDPEFAALQKIESRMDELETAQAIDPRPTFDAFRRALDEALSGSAGRLGPTGEGVFVSQFAAAAAMRFSAAYFVGMIEGAAPPALRENPLMPDRERMAAGGADAGLPLLNERRARERLQYLSAMATAPRRTLSYPVADPVGGRENHPSRWMLETASALAGERVAAGDLPSMSGAAWLAVITSPETALETVAQSVPADVHDYDVERVWRWTRDGRPARNHPIAQSGSLARALALGRLRNARRLTEWDGNLSKSRGLSRILNRPRHSPTSLERWASCPFSYFLGYGLRIGALDKPEDTYSLSPLERGSLIHDILEEFIRETAKSANPPKPGERWDDDARATLRSVAARRFRDRERAGVTGRRLTWRLDQDEILADLDVFLEWDSNTRERFGVSPSPKLVEARFGMGGESPDVEIALNGGESIRFRGMVDRIDVGESESGGKRALVMDYKTGSPRPYEGLDDDPFDHGKKLQLAVYSLAAREMLGTDARDEAPVEARAAYAFVTGRGGFEIRPSAPADYGLPDNQKKFREVLGAILGGIQIGVFPANPGESGYYGYENCRFCDFDSLCPSRRDVAWERKSGDKMVAGYLDLIREEEVE